MELRRPEKLPEDFGHEIGELQLEERPPVLALESFEPPAPVTEARKHEQHTQDARDLERVKESLEDRDFKEYQKKLDRLVKQAKRIYTMRSVAGKTLLQSLESNPVFLKKINGGSIHGRSPFDDFDYMVGRFIQRGEQLLTKKIADLKITEDLVDVAEFERTLNHLQKIADQVFGPKVDMEKIDLELATYLKEQLVRADVLLNEQINDQQDLSYVWFPLRDARQRAEELADQSKTKGLIFKTKIFRTQDIYKLIEDANLNNTLVQHPKEMAEKFKDSYPKIADVVRTKN